MNAAVALRPSPAVTPVPDPQPIVEPVEPAWLAREVASLPASAHLTALGDFDVYCSPAAPIPGLMREIGRLRETAFREVGEGTGREIDLDLYDDHYQHLFVWNRITCDVVGSYRVGLTHELTNRFGVSGLYTHSLFEFDERLFDRLGPSFELGRSFVNPKWQGNTRPLRLLWAGIAVLLERQPEIRHLFGPVSVSPRFSEFGRMLIMSALQLHHMDAALKSLIRARNEPRPPTGHAWQERLTEVSAGLADPGLLSKFLQRVEHGLALPMLIKHYIELKGRFAGFNVDASFNGTLDGLVFVRVQDIPAKMRARLTAGSTARQAQ